MVMKTTEVQGCVKLKKMFNGALDVTYMSLHYEGTV